jgi:hypothetical protein
MRFVPGLCNAAMRKHGGHRVRCKSKRKVQAVGRCVRQGVSGRSQCAFRIAVAEFLKVLPQTLRSVQPELPAVHVW